VGTPSINTWHRIRWCCRCRRRWTQSSRFGADLVVDVAVDDPVVALRDATGGLADVVVDVTAKAPAAFAQAIELARPAGTVVVAETRGWGTGAPGFVPDMVVLKELRIVGALGVDATAHRAALDVLASGRYPFAELPRRCVGLDEAEVLLTTMAGERDGVPPVHGVVTP
jgi:alcohol dehydrogenase